MVVRTAHRPCSNASVRQLLLFYPGVCVCVVDVCARDVCVPVFVCVVVRTAHHPCSNALRLGSFCGVVCGVNMCVCVYVYGVSVCGVYVSMYGCASSCLKDSSYIVKTVTKTELTFLRSFLAR